MEHKLGGGGLWTQTCNNNFTSETTGFKSARSLVANASAESTNKFMNLQNATETRSRLTRSYRDTLALLGAPMDQWRELCAMKRDDKP